jgi:WD40 repeat protein
VYALRSYDSVRRPRTHPGPVAFVEFSSDGSQVISYDMEGASRTWNATSSQLYPTVPTSIKLDPTSFRVEAGWLLYRRPQDDFSRRLLRLIAHFEPSSQIVTFGHSLAYGTRAGETVRIDLSDDLLL